MTFQRVKSGLFIFGVGCIGLDSIKTNNQEQIINNASTQVRPLELPSPEANWRYILPFLPDEIM